MAVIPKPPTWRLNVGKDAALYFRGIPPTPRRRRALKRWFGWKVEIALINGNWIEE